MVETSPIVKFSSPLTIQYITICDKPNYSDSEFYVGSFNLLRTLPIELIQIENSIQHFELCFRFKTVKTYELFSFPSSFFNDKKEAVLEKLNNYSKNFGVQSMIKVFIIDSTLNNHSKISRVLKSVSHAYYIVIGDNRDFDNIYPNKNFINNSEDFIKAIKRDIEPIKNDLKKFYENEAIPIDTNLELKVNPNGSFISENFIPGAILTWNNYFVLNQIIGNFWLGINSEIGTKKTLPENRIKELVEQSERIDSLFNIMYNQVGVKPTDPFQPLLPSLVLIQPYHYPKLSKLYGAKFTKKEKNWLSIQNSEQNLNYQHLISKKSKSTVSQEGIGILMRRNSLRLMFLDNIAYIHSMFTYSPVIRLPQIGKSINLELSHIENVTPKKKSTISNIEKFGKKLSKLTLSDISKNYIKNRNGQIFAISDLPLEWLYLEEYPLCFTHDVCRLPEFNLNSIVNNAIYLQRSLFQISEDLINKTLIIHCASKDDELMNHMFSVIDAHKQNLGFKSVKCSTIIEVSQVVKKYKPDLLIFVCHGGSDKNDLSSFLVVDDQKNEVLTGDEIVKHGISAPLVILSACKTFPNYGYVKLLSDAFMQVGAYCVTTTFLPIKIIDAATVIIRLLNNLNQLKQESYHMNWLNFLSHILRSSLIFETINKSRKHLKEEISNEEIAEIVTKSMRFENRLEALEELNTLIKDKSEKHITFDQLENDWLSYSIIGRADLIYFKNWLKEYQTINKG